MPFFLIFLVGLFFFSLSEGLGGNIFALGVAAVIFAGFMAVAGAVAF